MIAEKRLLWRGRRGKRRMALLQHPSARSSCRCRAAPPREPPRPQRLPPAAAAAARQRCRARCRHLAQRRNRPPRRVAQQPVDHRRRPLTRRRRLRLALAAQQIRLQKTRPRRKRAGGANPKTLPRVQQQHHAGRRARCRRQSRRRRPALPRRRWQRLQQLLQRAGSQGLQATLGGQRRWQRTCLS